MMIPVPDGYGNIIAVALGAIPVLGFVHGIITGIKRRAAGIPYPHSYATIEQCKADPKADAFNCAQRAHTNYLENAPQTMLLTLVAGLKYPAATTLIGATWVVMRVLFLYGYVYSGQAAGAGRKYGGGFWFAQMALWGMTVFGVALPMMQAPASPF
ncbi:hypothetical protein H112_05669 [Trichophyton rubrum D6]|uniref:Glutathione S-transferase n=5 Tax=Trichophyton TaxID=5550 RepID=A0A178EQX7_TRIRU|nr:uncharacterized protein TERG_03390 [Trichophyton rubrum CBS 118892]EZF16673.1 hypothetical protein H100_05686 [Trichophyton rubrum MR850]EZF40354.1 hypothetical protein H102_05655 [Trichophyton rubrum CBS 100081]EZF50859.1 hypothetical protein H103_05682 [Trichophyton rubrum CBS 288.86]EZF61577.1 hypothetical protein H104_05667 [Trichophyton rubrum CBS 289.86]EZF72340.1 hypothetical protein H105_05695 [Trichophyton soudanense CBS 452.61]EZF82999.1 hypothetical protein H110_05677 [Trichophy